MDKELPRQQISTSFSWRTFLLTNTSYLWSATRNSLGSPVVPYLHKRHATRSLFYHLLVCPWQPFVSEDKKSWGCSDSAPASTIQRGGPPLLPFPATPLPFLSCPLSYFNSRHKTLHFGKNFMKIGPKLKKLSMFKGQCYVYSIFEVFIMEPDYIL